MNTEWIFIGYGFSLSLCGMPHCKCKPNFKWYEKIVMNHLSISIDNSTVSINFFFTIFVSLNLLRVFPSFSPTYIPRDHVSTHAQTFIRMDNEQTYLSSILIGCTFHLWASVWSFHWMFASQKRCWKFILIGLVSLIPKNITNETIFCVWCTLHILEILSGFSSYIPFHVFCCCFCVFEFREKKVQIEKLLSKSCSFIKFICRIQEHYHVTCSFIKTFRWQRTYIF